MDFNPEFIYFDLDDTLLDHKYAERNALQDVHDHFELFGQADTDELIEVYHQVNSRQWTLYSREEVSREQLQRNRFELTLRELGLDDGAYSEVGSRYMQYYRNHWQWIAGAREAFEAACRHYPVGILTNGFAETQKLKFEQFELYEKAEHLVISEEVGTLKPHPSIFAHATELTGFAPDQILYVGDSYSSDVAGGTGFGWHVAWFTRNRPAADEQRAQADFVFDDFDDFIRFITPKGKD